MIAATGGRRAAASSASAAVAVATGSKPASRSTIFSARRIWVESLPGQGTTFAMEFPLERSGPRTPPPVREAAG